MNIQTESIAYYATFDEIRAVWAVVSKTPRVTVREMVKRTGVARTKVHHILKFLEGTGYIEHQPGLTGRKVIIPLVTL